ncbi:MAG: 16S rRNA (cytidine(1402)-2'-O)-methyltransferase [Vicinamibacterales bacterium]
MAGTLFVVATPIGNLDDLSARAIRVLREVAVIAAEDTRRTGHLLQRFGLTTRTTSFHEHSEKGKTAGLLARLQAGENVALVSDAGTPTVSDPGEHLIRLAHDAGIRVEPIPGPSAVVAALSVAGFGAGGFIFLGFPPTKASDRHTWIERIHAAASLVPAAIFYEAPHRIAATLSDLHRSLGDIEVVVARELTKAHEEILRTTLAVVHIPEPRGEFTVVLDIGQITADRTLAGPLDPTAVFTEFCDLTEKQGLNRRQAIASLARRYALPSRELYSLIEKGKSSGV